MNERDDPEGEEQDEASPASLIDLLDEMDRTFGKPSPEAERWARRVLRASSAE